MMASKAGLSKSELIPSGQTLSQGIANNFKDLLNLRKYEPPEIRVCEPQIKSSTTGKHHVYKVCGRDHMGDFEVFRRFSHFDVFRKVLYSRFLGLYVPPLPAKKAMVCLNL